MKSPMALLPILRALKVGTEKGQDCQVLLQELQQRLGSLALGTMRRMVSGQLADEDAILNTTLFSIANAIEGFRGTTEGEAVSYCKQVVTTKTLDHIRRARGRLVYVEGKTSRVRGHQVDLGEESTGQKEDPEAIPQPDGSDPETVVSRKEVLGLVRKALDCLKPLEREVVERVVVHGERITDIAGETGDEENTLTKRKNRALRKMRRILADQFEKYER